MRASAIRISEYQPREEDYDAYQEHVVIAAGVRSFGEELE
jgi:hypothetical protein